jgi:hypothetical protein
MIPSLYDPDYRLEPSFKTNLLSAALSAFDPDIVPDC